MSISSKKPDDQVGEGRKLDSFRQTPEQAAAIAQGGEEPGAPEPKSPADWAARGASGGEPGRPPVALGGSSQGESDRKPAGGATVSNASASNPKLASNPKPASDHETLPGERRES